MAPLAARAPPLTLRRAARAVGRGVECAPAPTWPEGPKEGSRRPRATVPLAASQLRADAAPPTVSACGRAALLHVRWPARPGALRAPLKS